MRKKGLMNEYNSNILKEAARSLENVNKELSKEVSEIANKFEEDRCKRSKGVSFKK
jgi:hypothetical protein